MDYKSATIGIYGLCIMHKFYATFNNVTKQRKRQKFDIKRKEMQPRAELKRTDISH